MIALADDIEIAYEDVGTGTPVVFLHGFPHTRALWAPQVNALVDRARCIAPDLRGFGESGVAPPWTMDRFADDLAKLLDAVRVDKAVLVGLSMGGYIAFAFWRQYRHRVRALVLADTRPGPDSPEARAKRQQLIALARDKGSWAVADAMINSMVGTSTQAQNPEVVESVYRMLRSAPVEGIVGTLEAMMERPDSTPTLATIDVPTLIVVGEEDILTPVAEARAMHAAIKGSRLEIIAGAGHVSNVERPATFNHLLSEFLASVELA